MRSKEVSEEKRYPKAKTNKPLDHLFLIST